MSPCKQIIRAALLLASASAWAVQRRPRPQTKPKNRLVVGLSMTPDQVVDAVQQAVTNSAVGPAEILDNIGDTDTEAAILSDLSDATEDLLMVFAPETIILRFGGLIGKILELAADYLPNKSVRGDELLFSFPVIAATGFLLSRSALPLIQGQFVALDERDLTVHKFCFAPVGITMLQFKAMKATGCFKWIYCESGEVLIDERNYDGSLSCDAYDESYRTEGKYLYWQLDGTVERSFRGKQISLIKRKNGRHINNPRAQGLLGDTRYLYHVEEETTMSGGSTPFHPIATITVVSGSRMLRIDSEKLQDLMDHDDRLESSIRLLLLKSLKLKIANLLLERDEVDDGAETCIPSEDDNPKILPRV